MQLSDYMELFPGASREKQRFMALAEAVLSQVMDLQALAEAIQPGFSFEEAVGVQLDAIAEAVGLSRERDMSDEDFRQYLLAKLKRWTWDGTNAGTPAVLPEGVTMNDNSNGTVTVTPSGTRQDLLPLTAGIRVTV